MIRPVALTSAEASDSSFGRWLSLLSTDGLFHVKQHETKASSIKRAVWPLPIRIEASRARSDRMSTEPLCPSRAPSGVQNWARHESLRCSRAHMKAWANIVCSRWIRHA